MYTLVPPFYIYFISNLALIDQAVSEKKIFDYYGNMYIDPGWGQTSTWGPFFFSESLIFSPFAHFLQAFLFKLHLDYFPHSNAWATYVDLP